MAVMTEASLKFTVRRQPAVLVAPAAPTPRELKHLSDVDDQGILRCHAPTILIYRRNASMDGRDPAQVIRDAIAKALVHYYPFAGRLRELEGRKLAVDCTGEGLLFVEADADVRLEQFGDALHPPFPCYEEIQFDVPGSSAVLNSPLFLFQVTRLACGGFILAVRMHHAMTDGQGVVQFLGAVAELARGAAVPTVLPVWRRELLQARNPPQPNFAHREYDEVKGAIVIPANTAHRSFFFGPREVAAIRAQLPPHLRTRATTFEVVTASLWKCRTMALAPDADEEMRLICVVSACIGKTGGLRLRLPSGYYGNKIVFPVAISTAGKLCANPAGYAVELVRQAKGQVDAEYVRSVADLMVLRGRPTVALMHAYVVSDLTKLGYGNIDFGWGQPLYTPVSKGTAVSSMLGPFKNANGENGIIVPIRLPGPAMDKFVEEMGKLLHSPADVAAPGVFPAKMSAL